MSDWYCNHERAAELTLVELQSYTSSDSLLGNVDRLADELHLRSEPEAVVAELCELGGEAVADLRF